MILRVWLWMVYMSLLPTPEHGFQETKGLLGVCFQKQELKKRSRQSPKHGLETVLEHVGDAHWLSANIKE